MAEIGPRSHDINDYRPVSMLKVMFVSRMWLFAASRQCCTLRCVASRSWWMRPSISRPWTWNEQGVKVKRCAWRWG